VRYKKLKTLWAAMERNIGFNAAHYERALGLDHGIIERALKIEKNGGQCPQELFAVMKIVYTFPWILRVADQNYDPKYAMKELCKHAVDILVETTYP